MSEQQELIIHQDLSWLFAIISADQHGFLCVPFSDVHCENVGRAYNSNRKMMEVFIWCPGHVSG